MKKQLKIAALISALCLLSSSGLAANATTYLTASYDTDLQAQIVNNCTRPVRFLSRGATVAGSGAQCPSYNQDVAAGVTANFDTVPGCTYRVIYYPNPDSYSIAFETVDAAEEKGYSKVTDYFHFNVETPSNGSPYCSVLVGRRLEN